MNNASAAAGHGETMPSLPGGTFQMGSDHDYPEEAPARAVHISSFQIDRYPVTNAQFAKFVTATGYVTEAEIPPNPADYPGLRPELAIPGSSVFRKPSSPSSRGQWDQWWIFLDGAQWRHPQGPRSSVKDRADHPVVHVSYADALVYAGWAGKDLPTEAEWEYAARGGLKGADYAWGKELAPQGRHMANTWQGQFPIENLAADGYEDTSPVMAFPPNGYGLHDMIGNVWEWTRDWFAIPPIGGQPMRPVETPKACCTPQNPRGGTEAESYDPSQPGFRIPRKVLKGGSHLCAPNYCRRYRPAARQAQQIDSAASHIGFRCVIRGRS